MKYILIPITILFITACGSECEVCEVLKDGEMIEKYESCDEEGIEFSKSICQEIAELQYSECECKEKDE